MKAIALAGSNPGTNLMLIDKRYDEKDLLENIDWESVCGHCRKFINDYTAGNTEDVTIYVVVNPQQAIRTTLRGALYPFPHKVTRVPLAPIRHASLDKTMVAAEMEKLPREIQNLKPFDFDNPRRKQQPQPQPHQPYSEPK